MTMFQVRIHGRGGQGVVSGAEMLSVAAFEKAAMRRRFRASAPNAWARRSWRSAASTTRRSACASRCCEPDALIIQDPTLLHQVDLFSGLRADGYILLNSTRSFDELGLGDFARGFRRDRLCTVPATELALKHVGRPCRTRRCSAASPRSPA